MGRPPEELLLPVIVAMARAMRLRGGQVPVDLAEPPAEFSWSLFGGVIR